MITVQGSEVVTGATLNYEFKAGYSQTVTVHGQSYTYYYCYTHERTIIKITASGFTGDYFGVEINNNVYYTDKNGVLYYDVTDELRGLTTSFLYLSLDNLRLRAVKGIDPDNLLIPLHPFFIGNNSLTTPQIMPPSKIYGHPKLSPYYAMQIQLYGIGASFPWDGYFKGDPDNPVTLNPGGNGENLVITTPLTNGDDDPDYVTFLDCSDLGVTIYFDFLQACESACVLRWLSESGMYKQAIWRMKKVKKSSEARGLLPLGDEYPTQKSEVVSFVAFIDGLDNYDYAYYADIINSPEVHCAMRSGEDLTDYTTAVQVTTNSYTLQDGNVGNLQTLEIGIAFKHYDTI